MAANKHRTNTAIAAICQTLGIDKKTLGSRLGVSPQRVNQWEARDGYVTYRHNDALRQMGVPDDLLYRGKVCHCCGRPM